jgi:DnaJ family protein A protein 2
VGVKQINRQIGPGMIQTMQQSCGKCKTTGRLIDDSDRCAACRGDARIRETKVHELHIKPGAALDEPIVLEGAAGCERNANESADVVVYLQMTPHPTFTFLQAPNMPPLPGALVYRAKISLCEALTGFEFQLKHLDGRLIRIHSSPTAHQTVQPDSWQCVRGEGMPIVGTEGKKGDLFIKYEVAFPNASQLRENVEHLRRILPLPAPLPPSRNMRDAIPESVDMNKEFSKNMHSRTQHPQEGCSQQ